MKIDKEYACTSEAEMIYLSDHGIRYTFVKVEKGITIYKYKKTKKLFETLAKLYTKMERDV